MFLRAASFGPSSESPPTSGPGVVIAEPGAARFEQQAAIFVLHGSVRASALDIEVERTEMLRGVFVTLVATPEQGALTANLVGPALVFPDDVADLGPDLVASFQVEVVIPRWARPCYLHAAYRQHVSNAVRIDPAGAPGR